MQQWTSETIAQRFSQLDGKTDPIFHIDANVKGNHSNYMTVVGDAQRERVNLRYSHSINKKLLAAGVVSDRQMQHITEELYIDYGSEVDLIPFSETISIEDALKIAIYFVEHEAMPPLLDHLYWNGYGNPWKTKDIS